MFLLLLLRSSHIFLSTSLSKYYASKRSSYYDRPVLTRSKKFSPYPVVLLSLISRFAHESNTTGSEGKIWPGREGGIEKNSTMFFISQVRISIKSVYVLQHLLFKETLRRSFETGGATSYFGNPRYVLVLFATLSEVPTTTPPCPI